MSNIDSKFQTAYPTKGEIIRCVYKMLGLSKPDKELDRFAQGDFNYKLERRYLEDIQNQLNRYLGHHFSNIVLDCLHNLLNHYTNLVVNIPLEGMSRAKALDLLIDNYYGAWAAFCVTYLTKEFDSPVICELVFNGGSSAVATLDTVFSKCVPEYTEAFKKLDKDTKDKFKRWTRGSEEPNAALPDAPGIYNFTTELVNNWPYHESEADKKEHHSHYCMLLLTAVSVERCKRVSREVKTVDIIRPVSFHLKDPTGFDVGAALSIAVYENSLGLEDYKDLNILIHHQLYNKDIVIDEGVLEKQLAAVRQMASEIDRDNTTTYYIDWLDGRFSVLKGELEKGAAFYKEAVTKSLYRAGENQKVILTDALCLAAYLGDRPWMKAIKNQLISFGFVQAPSYRSDTDLVNKKSRSNNDIIEDWEIKNWVHGFNLRFPEEKRLPSFKTMPTKFKASFGPIFLSMDQIERELNLTKPNKYIIIEGKRWPQLVFFSEFNDVAKVEALLNAGASVDELSSSEDSAILCAINEMDPFGGSNSMSDACFNAIASYPHKAETLNTLTVKRRLSPLKCAVNTGRYKVVKKVIELGADVNKISGVEGTSPLVECISLLDLVRHPYKLKDKYYNQTPSIENIEAARRFGNGLMFANSQEGRKEADHDVQRFIGESFIEFCIRRFLEHTSIESFKNILKELLKFGANPNIQYEIGQLKKFTPLMLAAELDDVSTLELLVSHGACIEATDSLGRTALAIAKEWKSENAISYLSSLD
ncbi:ankyrin repeat domain-containing protein [Marinobacterium aestuariivivens]|uniref:Ankyrin repeat domain-containing protein n=1 Tax=Marinobacterium aestuariivivens TaxID=1698799 RepID=A0ABW2A6U6_9GAMM